MSSGIYNGCHAFVGRRVNSATVITDSYITLRLVPEKTWQNNEIYRKYVGCIEIIKLYLRM